MTGGKGSRDKGARFERDIVDRHKAIGIHAERYPASGATHFRGAGHDVDLYVFGPDEAPLVSECKARSHGQGFTLLERWLGDYDELFLHRDRADPLVVLPWETYARLVARDRWHGSESPSTSAPRRAAISGKPVPSGTGADNKEASNGTTQRAPNGAGSGLAAGAARKA
jgi:hypothetical protein